MEKIRTAGAFILLLVLAAGLWPASGRCARRLVIEAVTLAEDGPIQVRFSGEPHYKVVRLGGAEWLVAFKPATLAQGVPHVLAPSAGFKALRFSSRPQEVVTLEITTAASLEGLEARWQRDGRILTLTPVYPAAPGKSAPAGGRVRDASPPPPAKPAKTAPPSGRSAPGPAATGGLDDLFTELTLSPCARHPQMDRVLTLCRQRHFDRATAALAQFCEDPAASRCRQDCQILQGFIAYKLNQGAPDPDQAIRAISTLQEAISAQPSSPHLPYLMGAMGKLYLAMDNLAEANGYFNLALNQSPSFAARPEILLEQARIQIRKKLIKQGMDNLHQIITQYPGSAFATDAELELGICLYEISDYAGALERLAAVAASDPRKAYASPALLRYMGESHYQLGEYDQARETLSQALNLFPEDPATPILLTRIGDIYTEQKHPEKAQKFFRLVMRRYPGTDAYAISALRLAGLLADPREKAELYNKVMLQYPDHPMAEFAALRLAQLHQAEGQHAKSLSIAAKLLASSSGEIQQKTLFHMRDTYLQLFRQQMDQGNYPAVLTAYEKDKQLIQEFYSPELYHLIGEAYCQGHLYAPAAEVLDQAYRLYLADRRPPALLFDLGKALQEAGRPEEALAMLDRYIAAAPKGSRAGEAHLAKAQLLRDRKAFAAALHSFDEAYRHAGKEAQADILLAKARIHEQLAETGNIPPLLVKAINLMASRPEDQYGRIFEAYQMLGKVYMQKKDYLKAADALEMALKFGQDSSRLADVKYQLGQAYQHGNAVEKAASVYKAMLQSDDAFWAKLAGEKLRGMELAKQLNQS